MTRDEVAATFGLDDGTVDRLGRYAALVTEWQARLNLVGPATLGDIWGRHIADSVQLARLGVADGLWMDMGAGGGFPGVVLGILGRDRGVGGVVLVESVAKKCAFLREAIAVTGAEAEVRHGRVEVIAPVRAHTITARALASLPQLFDWGMRHARGDTVWVLPKGARHAEERNAAREVFDYSEELVPSMTDDLARIVVARGVRRAR